MREERRPALPPPEPALRFNPWVHGARGLFSGAVFCFHVVNSGLGTLDSPLALYFLRSTEYGVELFFGISGYVIAGTLRRSTSYGAFLADRAIRIFPVLWVTVLAIALITPAVHWRGAAFVNLGDMAVGLLANLLALPGIFPLSAIHPAAWSLSYEMAFYIFAGAAWTLHVCGRTHAALALLACLVPLLALYPRALLFVSGVVVAERLTRYLPLARLARFPALMLLLFLAAWAGIQQLSLPEHIINTTLIDWASDLRLPLAMVAVWAATLGFDGLAAGRGLIGRLLLTRALQYMGTISYSFYLWHPLVMAVIKATMLRAGLAQFAWPWSQVLFLLLALPPSLVVSDLSQRVLERALGRWLRRRAHHRTAAVRAVVSSGTR